MIVRKDTRYKARGTSNSGLWVFVSVVMLFCVAAAHCADGASGSVEPAKAKESVKSAKDKDGGADSTKKVRPDNGEKVVVSGKASEGKVEEKAGEKVKEAPTIAELKTAIIEKNIFQPTNVPIVSFAHVPKTAKSAIDDSGPKRLVRPFTVLAFDETETGTRVWLEFDKPTERLAFKVNDMIEGMVKIVEIESPTTIRCEYGGKPVRIDRGETSDDAFRRLGVGLSSNYYLRATTGSTAWFYFPDFPQGNRLRAFKQGEILGNGKIVRIERGQVVLQSLFDNTIRTIKITMPPSN